MSDNLLDRLTPLSLETVLTLGHAGINTDLMEFDGEFCCCMSRSPNLDPAISFAPTLDFAVSQTVDIARVRWPDLFNGGKRRSDAACTPPAVS